MDLQLQISNGLYKLNKLKLKNRKPITKTQDGKTLKQTNKQLSDRVDNLQNELNKLTNAVLMLVDDQFNEEMQKDVYKRYKSQAYTLAAFNCDPDMQETINEFLDQSSEYFGEKVEQSFFDIIYGESNDE